MTKPRFYCVWGMLFVLMMFSCLTESRAAEPFRPIKNLFEKNTVEADPNKEYPLQATNGPWLILVSSFTGPSARQNANALVFELRHKYKLKAYTHQMTFTFDIKKDAEINATRGVFQKRGTEQQYAVFVGDFLSEEDTNFKKMCQKVKDYQPESMRNVQGLGRIVGSTKPFAMAFGMPNPLLPPKLLPGEVEPFVVELNQDKGIDIPYSLLNCPGRYTLKVGTFTGETGMARYDASGKLNDKSNSKKTSELVLAAKAAHQLCQSLRNRGFEAYEFHDRYSSIVTVGSFNDIGYKLPNGYTEIPRPILDLMNQFQAKRVSQMSTNSDGPKTIPYQPLIIDGAECDVTPQLIEVPRRPAKR